MMESATNDETAAPRNCKLPIFASPHLFFLVYEDEEHKLGAIKDALERDFFAGDVVVAPKINTLYVVRDKDRAYKRVMILKKKGREYSCWLVDYGKVISTDVLYKLPASCDMEPLSFKAGLSGTVALESEITEMGHIAYYETDRFSEMAIKKIKDYIRSSTNIGFIEEHVFDDIRYGQLVLTGKDNRVYNLIDYLCTLKMLVVDKKKFDEVLKESFHLSASGDDEDEDIYVGEGVGRASMRNASVAAFEQEQQAKQTYVSKWLKMSVDQSETLSQCHNLEEDQRGIETESPDSGNIILKHMRSKPIGRGQSVANLENTANRGETSYEGASDENTSQSSDKNVTSYHMMLEKIRERLKKTPPRRSEHSEDKSGSGNTEEMTSNSSEFLGSDAEYESSASATKPDVAEPSRSDTEWDRTDMEWDNGASKPVCNLADPYVSDDDIAINSVCNKKNLLKIGCSCSTCKMWTVKGFEDVKEKFVKKPRKKVVKPFPLLRSDDAPRPAIKTMADLVNDLSTTAKTATPNVLTHGPIIPFPQRYLREIPFVGPIHDALRKLEYVKNKPIQMYAWPAIMRNMNLCVTHSPKSGKSMVYIPSVCSFMLEKDRYANLPKGKGPLVIVLCPESKQVEDVNDLMVTLMSHVVSKQKIKISAAFPPVDTVVLKQFAYPTDILITTLMTLLALLSKTVINLKRLCHLVVEHVDVILDNFKEPFRSILDVTEQMLGHRSCANQVQFICTSEHWTRPLEKFARQLNSVPLVCIGSHIESALYGRADIQVLDVKSHLKPSRLYDILKDIYLMYKTVVICKQDEIANIIDLFRACAIRIIVAEDTMTGVDIIEAQNCWLSTTGGGNMVMICTDYVFDSHLNITNASLLINYSLPKTWGSFVKRWSCLIDNYKSPLGSSEPACNCKVITFADEHCGKEFPTIANYFLTVGTKLPEGLVKFCENYKQKQEELKIQTCVRLCSQIKEFGECLNIKCQYRHQMSPALDAKRRLSMTGLLRFQIRHTKHVNRFLAIPVEYEDPDGKVHGISNMSRTIAKFLKCLRTREIPDEVKINTLYILEEGEQSSRCIVRRIVEYDARSRKPLRVAVEGLDLPCAKVVSTVDLYELPESLKKIPPVLKEIILANVIPLHNEMSWTLRSRKLVIRELENADYKDPEIQCVGNVLLELGNTIWIEDLQVQKYLPMLKTTVNRFTLHKFLVQKNLIKADGSRIEKLYRLCEKYEITLPKYEKARKEKAQVAGTQVKPQWAHLSDDSSYHCVNFSSGFTPDRLYVRLIKFDQLYQNLQHLIDEYVSKQKFETLSEAELQSGNCFLAPDPETPNIFCRVLIMGIDKGVVDCFYVDFGDLWHVNIEDLKPIPDRLISKLPFQAIECRLHGVSSPDDVWPNESVDVLYQYCHEKNSDIFRTLYMHPTSVERGHFDTNNKYSVLLFDYSDSAPILINTIMIDCGLAVPSPDEHFPVDFDLVEAVHNKTCEDYESDEDCKEEDDTDPLQKFDIEFEENPALPSDSGSDFDFQVVDEELFFIELGLKVRPVSPAKPSIVPDQPLPQIKAAPLSDVLSPEVRWHQTEKLVKIEILLCVPNYDLKLVAGRVLTFQSTYDDKKYDLKLQLFKTVNKTFSQSSQGPSVKVVLFKLDEAEWPRLVLGQEAMRNVKYDLDKCDLPGEEDTKRPFLHIGEDLEDEIVTEMILEVDSDEYDSDESDWSND